MRSIATGLFILICTFLAPATFAASGSVIKVLPQFLDLKGRHSVSPSLYDRDAYQAFLRKHPRERSGIRFAIQWKARVPKDENLKLRVELRGVVQGKSPKELTLEKTITERYFFSHWSDLELVGKAYDDFGEVTAWRATLWSGDQLLGEQKSFLW